MIEKKWKRFWLGGSVGMLLGGRRTQQPRTIDRSSKGDGLPGQEQQDSGSQRSGTGGWRPAMKVSMIAGLCIRRQLQRLQGMVQAWVGQKLVNVIFYEFLWCPFFAMGPQFQENRDILEVIHYNIKLLYMPLHISILVHLPSPWLSIDMSYP